MARVPEVFEECRAEFVEVFGRDSGGAIQCYETDDADNQVSADTFFSALVPGQTLVEAQWQGNVADASVPARELEIED